MEKTIAPSITAPGPPIEQPLPPSKTRHLSLSLKPVVKATQATPTSSSLQPGAKQQKPITSFFSAPHPIHPQSTDGSGHLMILSRPPLAVVRGNNSSTSSINSKNPPSTSTTRVLPAAS
ncbi:hypothetical protein HK100_002915, partial [Physocladia obscura]